VQVILTFGWYNLGSNVFKEFDMRATNQTLRKSIPKPVLFRWLQNEIGILFNVTEDQVDLDSSAPFKKEDIYKFVPRIKRMHEMVNIVLSLIQSSSDKEEKSIERMIKDRIKFGDFISTLYGKTSPQVITYFPKHFSSKKCIVLSNVIENCIALLFC